MDLKIKNRREFSGVKIKISVNQYETVAAENLLLCERKSSEDIEFHAFSSPLFTKFSKNLNTISYSGRIKC